MHRIEELWSRWIQDQPTKTLERLIELANHELTRRKETEASWGRARAAVARTVPAAATPETSGSPNKTSPTRGEGA
jgi:hypothetical protein